LQLSTTSYVLVIVSGQVLPFEISPKNLLVLIRQLSEVINKFVSGAGMLLSQEMIILSSGATLGLILSSIKILCESLVIL